MIALNVFHHSMIHLSNVAPITAGAVCEITKLKGAGALVNRHRVVIPTAQTGGPIDGSVDLCDLWNAVRIGDG